MPKIIYTPKALDDLQELKKYITEQFGEDKAKNILKEITTIVRQLELFPAEGFALEKLIDSPTEYKYLVIKHNYIFYRIENDTVRIIRVLNEKQDFLQILYGISSISKEGEAYWREYEEE